MWSLSATTHKLQVKLGGSVSTTQPSVHAYWVQYDSSAPYETPGTTNTTTNNTTAVDVVAVPSTATSVRDVRRLLIYNRDSASVTVQIGIAVSGSFVPTLSVALASGSVWAYDHDNGIQVFDSAGSYLTANTISTTTLLNSTHHSDTLTSSVSRGAIIYGNSTPKWAALTVGAANRLLVADGTDIAWAQADHGAALSGLSDDDHTQYVLNNGTRATTILAATAGDYVRIGGGATASELRFLEPSGSGSNYTAFKAQAQSGDVTYTLPAADGTSGYALVTNGSGTLSWSSVSSSFSIGGLSTVAPENGVDYVGGYDGSGSADKKFWLPNLLKADNRHSITIANNGTDASHDLDVTWGFLLDSTGVYQFYPGSQTVEIDNTFDGTGNKGRASGATALTTSQTNYLFLGAKTDGTQRLFFDTSISAANIPSGYTYYRRIFALKTDGSSAIRAGTYKNGEYVYSSEVTDVSGAAAPASAQLDTLTVPTGIKLRVKLTSAFQATGGGTSSFRISDPDTSDIDPSYLAGQQFTHISISGSDGRHERELYTNTSGQVRVRRYSGAAANYTTVTLSYYDPLVT